MKYYINYTSEGQIVGFLTMESDTNLNIEVSNAIWFEAQSFNKIIIDGDNISFDKVDWRTMEEILQQEQGVKTKEANSYLKETDWVETYKLRHDLGLELISEESSKWVIINKREEYKLFLKNLEGGN